MGLITALVAVMVGIVGCAGQTVAGTPTVMEGIDPDSAGDMEVTDGPNGSKEGVAPASLEVEGTDGGEMDIIATNAIADLYDYWHEQMPEHFDQEFEELQRLLSYDSNGEGAEICGESTAGLVNAFYCGGGGEDVIAWDRGELLPALNEMFGEMSVVGVLAHEMGHAVQFRLGEKSNMDLNTPTIVREQQADCYMGNYFRYVADRKSKYFDINTSDGLNKVLATLFFIRDPAGAGHMEEGAHGLAFDRVFAFQEGFTKDPARCAEMDTEEIDGRIAEKERTDTEVAQSDEGDIDPTDPKYVEALQTSLDAAFEANGVDQPEFVDNGSTCESGDATSPVTYCPDENIIGYDAEALRELAAKPDPAAVPGEADSGGLGDFAAFAELASRYALAVQKSIGAPLDDPNAGLRTSCLTGAWAAYTNSEERGTGDLRLAIGDLDEAVAELLLEDSLIAADVKGVQVPSGFARVEAFRRGFMEGSGPCTEDFS